LREEQILEVALTDAERNELTTSAEAVRTIQQMIDRD